MIDSHTHIYPDKIAAKVAAGIKGHFPLQGDFTLGDLKGYMKRYGIEAVVTFCVADRPQAVAAANDFLIGITDNRTIFGFGTILPGMDDPVAEVKRIHARGLKGIKFHSLFQ
ncbi:MAG TPA: amidohydrolase, partial [Thermodesulfobacteriota bacterium]|nr:amidohydrolase [Thermodesulfobacteriota bacterium]